MFFEVLSFVYFHYLQGIGWEEGVFKYSVTGSLFLGQMWQGKV